MYGVGNACTAWVTAMRFQFTCEGCGPGDCERVSVSRKVSILKSTYLSLFSFLKKGEKRNSMSFETFFTLEMIYNSPPCPLFR